MADEPENATLVLLHAIRDEQQAARARSERTDQKIERMNDKLDRLATQSHRAARRAEDVMASQTRIQTDIAAIRAHLEDGERRLVDEFRQDTEDLTRRVEVLEARKD